MSPEQVSHIVERHNGNPGSLIAILQEIQARYGYLPAEALRIVAGKTGRSLVNVHGVATFYNSFSLEPRGRHLVRVCQGTACHVRGGRQILEKVLRELDLPESGTTPDFEFSVEPVRCLGCCALAPVMRVDTSTHGHLRQAKVPGILERYRSLEEVALA